MDIKLNILPPEEKMIIAGRAGRRRILTLGIFGFGLNIIFLIILSTILAYLLIQLSSEQQVVKQAQSSEEGMAFENIQKSVLAANKKLKDFSDLEKGSVTKSKFIEALIALRIPGIQFSQLSYDNEKINLEGKATTRDALIAFREALENSSSFGNLDAPLSNFLKQSDIDFSFSFTIKKP